MTFELALVYGAYVAMAVDLVFRAVRWIARRG